MATLEPTIVVEVELAGSGAGWTDLAADVAREAGLVCTHGIDGSGPSDLLAGSPTARFSLNNSERNSAGTLGYYSLYHASKRAGWALGIGCRIRLIDPADASSHTRFVGRLDAIDPMPGVNSARQVRVLAVGWLDEAARWALTATIGEQVGLRGDQILTHILAVMPSQPTATSFDSGSEAYPFALDTSASNQTSALEEFGKLAASEVGLIYTTAAGTLRYESRHQRMLDTTSDWTLSDTDLSEIELPSTRDEILNTVRVTYHPKIVDPLPTTIVYEQTNAIFVAAGATKTLLGPFRDPDTGETIGATNIQAQVAGTDYVAHADEAGVGADLTADFVVAVTAGPAGLSFAVTNNNASGGYLTTNRVYGRGIYDRGSVQVEARDAASVTTYGEHVAQIDMVYQDNNDVAQGAANYLLAKYKDPLAQVRRVTVVGKTAAAVTQILARDISDRLTLSETVTGANSSFFINGIELTVLPEKFVRARYTLAPAQDPFSGLYWILGTSTLGTDTIPAPF